MILHTFHHAPAVFDDVQIEQIAQPTWQKPYAVFCGPCLCRRNPSWSVPHPPSVSTVIFKDFQNATFLRFMLSFLNRLS